MTFYDLKGLFKVNHGIIAKFSEEILYKMQKDLQ